MLQVAFIGSCQQSKQRTGDELFEGSLCSISVVLWWDGGKGMGARGWCGGMGMVWYDGGEGMEGWCGVMVGRDGEMV